MSYLVGQWRADFMCIPSCGVDLAWNILARAAGLAWLSHLRQREVPTISLLDTQFYMLFATFIQARLSRRDSTYSLFISS